VFFDHSDRGKVAYILNLGHKGIRPLGRFDLDGGISTGMRPGFRSAAMQAGNSGQGSQSPVEDLTFVYR
jgi:hypothetical protein